MPAGVTSTSIAPFCVTVTLTPFGSPSVRTRPSAIRRMVRVAPLVTCSKDRWSALRLWPKTFSEIASPPTVSLPAPVSIFSESVPLNSTPGT